MTRSCTGCGRSFTPKDLCREESRGLEHDRRAAHLEGVRFLYYHCPGCGLNDIFVDVLPTEGEDPAAFEARREALEDAVRKLHAEANGTDAALGRVLDPAQRG